MAHSNTTQAAAFIDVPLSFRRGDSGWKTQIVRIRDQGSRQANNAAALQHATQRLGYGANEVEPFLTGE